MDIMVCNDENLLGDMYETAKMQLLRETRNSDQAKYLKDKMLLLKRRLRRLGAWEEVPLTTRPFGDLRKLKRRKKVDKTNKMDS